MITIYSHECYSGGRVRQLDAEQQSTVLIAHTPHLKENEGRGEREAGERGRWGGKRRKGDEEGEAGG